LADRTRELLAELVKLRSAWETCIVEVRTGDLTTTLFVNFGEIAAVKASKPGEPIGRIMLRKRLISREHYIEVLERLGDVANTGERVAFGELAVGLGYAKAADVSGCLTEQVRALAMRVFQDAAPEWQVLPMPADRDPSRDLTMRVESVFLEAVRMLDLPRKGALGLDDARPKALRPAWDPQEIDVRFELTDEEAEFVRVALAGDKTVAQVLSAGAPAGVDPASVLTALLASGAAESRELVAAEQHSKPEPRKGPPPLPAWATVDEAKAKGAAETAARASKRSLAPPSMTASPLEQLLRAEQVFERGRDAYGKGDLKAALAEFESALALNGASQECRLFARWTQHKASGEKLTATVRDELERLAREALRENSQVAIAHYVLSVIHEAWGRTEEARAALARARDLDRDLFGAAPSPVTPATAAMPVPAPAPPAIAAKPPAAPLPAAPAAPAKKSGSGTLIVSLALLVIIVIGGVVIFRQQTQATVAPVPTAPPPPAPSASPTDAGADAAPARATPAASAKAPPTDKNHGVVQLPKGSAVHRIFVDGKTYSANASDQLVVLCGHREIRIGSAGTARPIEVPCGGEIDLH
jgi:tetratricopeptide (TPR) repeat protein